MFSGNTLPGNKSDLVLVIQCLSVILRVEQRFSRSCLSVCINEVAEIGEIVAPVKTPHDF